MLLEGLAANHAFVETRAGDSRAAIAGAAKRIEAVYDYPFQNNACMEPMNATALYTAQRCEVWCPTQDGEAAHAATAEAAGLPADQCDVHKVSAGGGFGRRLFSDYVTQAVLVAKQVPGTPVKLLWSREEDMAQGKYHPVTKARLTGGIADDGSLAGLEIRLAGPSIAASVKPEWLEDGKDPAAFIGYFLRYKGSGLAYDIANQTIDHAMRNTHVPPGWWRGVNVNQNALFLECFIDELAHAAGRDALAFRRALMERGGKSLAVLDAVAARGGWGGESPPGRYRDLRRCAGTAAMSRDSRRSRSRARTR
jgi:isoquinoline 1-oxidoreductase beta subunit